MEIISTFVTSISYPPGARCSARIVPDIDRPAALDIYLRRFPDVRRLSEAPANDAERQIGVRLGRIPLWRLAPSRIRIIDNRERFGWKQELAL